MAKYLVTGATGFIGTRLINAIDGEIRILSRTKHPDREVVVCDLQSGIIPEDALYQIDTVFHLAGFAHDVRDSSKMQHIYHTVNADATVELAKLAVKFNVKRFVFVSSVKAGGLPSFGQCANEKTQGKLGDVYGDTKRKAELALLDIAKKSDMHISIIRPSLVYGPSVKGNLQLMLSGISKGWFPPLPEISNRRSMIHVDDLVRAILLIERDQRANGEVFIATDGTPHSSRDIYNAMCEVLGKPIPRWSVPKLVFDMVGIVCPRVKHKIRKLLGDECYSSAKLEALGFQAKKTLKDMNETDF